MTDPKTVTVLDPAGNPRTVTQEQTQAGLPNSITPIGAERGQGLQRAKEAEEYVDQNWGTVGKALAGAASGISAGIGPAVAVKAGLIDPDNWDAASQSGAFKVADYGAMLAPAILSDGASTAAEGGVSLIGRTLSATPMGLINRAGGAAERVMASVLPEAGLAGKALSPAIKLAARGAVEGGLISATQQATNDIIDNNPLTASALLSAGAGGALFGGAAGGLLGGAGALAGVGIDAAVDAGAGAGEKGMIRMLKRVGKSDAEIAELMSNGGAMDSLLGYGKTLGGAGVSMADSTPVMRDAMVEAGPRFRAAVQESLADAQRAKPMATDGRMGQLGNRIYTDAAAKLGDSTVLQQVVQDIIRPLDAVVKRGTWAQAATQYEVLSQDAAKFASDPVKGPIYDIAKKAFAGELSAGLQRVDPELAAKFGGSVTSAKIAEELAQSLSKKSVAEAGRASPFQLSGQDALTMGYGTLHGNPLGAAAIVAGRKVANALPAMLEPSLAEAAYRAQFGAAAAHATTQTQSRIASAVKSFLGTGAKGASRAAGAQSHSGPKYSMEAYRQSLDLADSLTSQAHASKVQETVKAIETMGHPNLAQGMLDTYQAAAGYVQQNRPKGRMGGQPNGLTKQPKMLSPNTDAMKFIRQIHALTDPLGTLVHGLETGSISRDEVAAIKTNIPPLHQAVVQEVSSQLLAMHQDGKFLAADKIATLCTVLDAPVDPSYQPDFVRSVQQGLAAANSPQPQGQGDSGPPPNGAPVTDISQFQTPSQKAAT